MTPDEAKVAALVGSFGGMQATLPPQVFPSLAGRNVYLILTGEALNPTTMKMEPVNFAVMLPVEWVPRLCRHLDRAAHPDDGVRPGHEDCEMGERAKGMCD